MWGAQGWCHQGQYLGGSTWNKNWEPKAAWQGKPVGGHKMSSQTNHLSQSHVPHKQPPQWYNLHACGPTIIDDVTSELLEYWHLIKCPESKVLWQHALANGWAAWHKVFETWQTSNSSGMHSNIWADCCGLPTTKNGTTLSSINSGQWQHWLLMGCQHPHSWSNHCQTPV